NLTLDEIFRTNQILNSLKKDNYTSNRIDRLSLRQLRLLHKCISVISEEYPSNYVSTINNYVDNCIKFRLSYVAQHTAVKNKQTYQDLIENASLPLYGSLENDDKINILFDGAKKIAKRIHEKQYLKDSWKDRSIRAFEKDKYCALKAYELGYITIDDLSTFLVLCDFQIDSIVYPEAQIKIKAIDIETATKKNIPTGDRGINNLLEFYLFNSAWRANETEYKLIVELIKTLPSHSQLLFEISFKYDEAPGFYQKIPRQFFGMGQYGDSGIVEIPFYPQSIYEVIRKVHFCGMPLVNIKHAIGVIDETQIAEDMYRNTHVMNYNFPSQEKMLKADG